MSTSTAELTDPPVEPFVDDPAADAHRVADAPARARRHGPSTGRTAIPIDVIGWTVVALLVGFSGERAWAGSVNVPGANSVAVGLILVSLAGMAFLLSHRGPVPRWAQVLLLTALAVGIGYQAVQSFLYTPAYGTDAAAFDQYAAMLARHGQNPYTASMQPAMSLFHVPAIFHTYRLDGTAVTRLSYPAGSFLPYVPLLALGVTTQAANIVDLLFWIAGMFVLWRCLPRDMKWLAGVLGSAGLYVGFVIGGLTDALFVPFVIVAVYRWDGFVDSDRAAWKRWLSPLALGVAISIKQTPWFMVPFLLLGLWCECRARGLRPASVLLRYSGALAGVFALVNAPFLLTSPAAWAKGALAPFLESTIPDGQGLVNLAIFHGIGGGDLRWFSALGALFVAACLVAFAARFDVLKRSWVPLIAVGFFLPTRSFGSYLFMLFPAALVAATTVRPARAIPFPLLRRRAVAVLTVLAVMVAATAAVLVTRTPPLRLTILTARSTGQLQTLDQVQVRVTNRTSQAVRPHFTVNSSDHATTFWYVLGNRGVRPVVIAAHATRIVTLDAPNTASMPALTSPLFVEAFTASPATVSVSHSYLVSGIGTQIVPDAINKPVPVGVPITVRVQAEDRYGAPVRRAGIPVVLNQTVYGQAGFYPGEASINLSPEGHSPVLMRTDRYGVAAFTVVGRQAQNAPVYFQAWIADRTVPYGYSNQVSIQFIDPK